MNMNGIILFADNKIFEDGHENELFKLFRQNTDYSVLPIETLPCLEETIKSATTFKACIIDWNFTDSDDFNEDFGEDFGGVERPNKTPLTILQNHTLYSLVYIYSGIDIPENDKDVLEAKYGNKIRFRSKTNDVEKEYHAILEDVRKFETDNPHMEIPFFWSQAINKSAQTIFNDLENADPCWIKEIRDTAINDGGDATSEIIDIFNNLLNEDLIQNKQLRDCLDAYNSTEKIKKEENTAKLYQRIYYSKLNSDAPIMTGDIFHFSANDTWGVLITPECEVAKRIAASNSLDFLTFKLSDTNNYLNKSCTFDRLRETFNTLKEGRQKNLRKLFNNEDLSTHILPSFPSQDNVYNQMIVIDFKNSFETKTHDEYSDKRINYKLNSPYIYQLRQRYISFFGKYGVPAIPESLRDYNLKG